LQRHQTDWKIGKDIFCASEREKQIKWKKESGLHAE